MWDKSTNYNVDDCVAHNSKLYQSLGSNINIEPSTDTSVWQVLVSYVPENGITWRELRGNTTTGNHQNTPYLSLIQPLEDSKVRVSDLNDNMDILDTNIKLLNTNVSGIKTSYLQKSENTRAGISLVSAGTSSALTASLPSGVGSIGNGTVI